MNVFLPANVSNRLPGLLKLFVVLWALMIQSVSANSQYSGSWYNSDRDGEGFHIEMLEDDQVLVIWFTYPGPTDDPSAEQAWILGSGTITDNTITIIGANKFQGPEFGPDYNKDDLVLLPWGDLSIVFSGNNNATVEYDGLDGEGTTDVIRITSMAQRENATRIPVGFSGAWYNPDTNGQGWFVEVLSDESALVYFFTYDANGNQAWNLAVGYLDGNRIVVPNSQTGKGTFFGTQFDTKDVVRESFVDIALEFENCKSGRANYKTKDGEHSGSMPIERITTLAGNECKALILKPGEGGSIESSSGSKNCREGKTCLVDVQDGASFSDTFTAVSRPGYVFKGWQGDGDSVCADSMEPCVPDPEELSGQNNDSFLTATFAPEGSIYFPTSDSLTVCSLIDQPETIETECEIKSFELYGYGKLEDYVVTNDILFVDTKARNKELDLLSQEEREVWCGAWAETVDYANFTPTPPVDIWDDVALDEMALPLYWARIHHDYLGNQDASGLILRSLLSYANAGVWLGVDIKTDGENRQYNLALSMMTYELAWKSIREEELVSIEEREVIDQYFYDLHRVISDSPGKAHDCDKLEACSEVFNHSWSRDLASMTSGVLTKNNELFRLGIKGFFAILDGIVRPDGSHYHESQRGGTATLYSVNATSTMIRMAELATNQGFNLYDVEIDGISLHKIVEFHLRVLEDETVIHQYANRDGEQFCDPPEVCDDYNDQAKYWSFDQPWSEFEIYRRRFPSSPLVERFLALYPADEHKQPPREGPILHVCEFRKIAE